MNTNYIVIELTHDTTASKSPFARLQRYSNGNVRLFADRAQAEQSARQSVKDKHNGILSAFVERIK